MPTRYSQSVTAFAAVGSLAYGYASSIIAYTIGFPSFFDYMGLVANTDHSNSIIGAANGLYVNTRYWFIIVIAKLTCIFGKQPGGGCLGCLFTAWSGEVFGRKRSMQIGCIIGIVGASKSLFRLPLVGLQADLLPAQSSHGSSTKCAHVPSQPIRYGLVK